MSRFNNLRLAYRLGLAFGAMALALVVIGAVSVSKINALNAGATALSDHDMVSQQHVLNIQSDVQRASYLVTSHLYVHDGELATQDAVAKEIAALTKTDAAELKGLKASADGAAIKPLIAKLATARGKFDAAVTTAVRRSRDETVRNVEERDGSRGYYASTVVPAADAVTASGTALIRESAREVAAAKARTQATAASGRKTIVIVAIIAALAAVGLAFLVVTSVVRPLKVVVERLQMLRDVCISGLTDGIEAMATGDLTKTVEPKTPQIENPAGDEVGDVARSFNDIQSKMVDAIAGLQRDAHAARLARRQRVELGPDAVGRLAADGDHLRGGGSRGRRDRIGRGRGRPGRRAPGPRCRAGEDGLRGGRHRQRRRCAERAGHRRGRRRRARGGRAGRRRCRAGVGGDGRRPRQLAARDRGHP